MNVIHSKSMCLRLHELFSAMPRYKWDQIAGVPFTNGIYIIFEKGEEYHGMDRIVRVGTHRADGRLKRRLYDHFVSENHDGSIFRKNIGKAMLNADRDPYLSIWTLNTSKPENRKFLDKAKNAEIEARVSRYLRESCSFTVFPVENETQRLRLEEAIISTLHREPDFGPSSNWSGRFSTENEIRSSGLWLKQGLDSEPLSELEFSELRQLCSASSNVVNGQNIVGKTITYNKLVRDRIPEIIEQSGKSCTTAVLSDEEYLKMIDAKLDEELTEYHKDKNIEELADLLEVIYAAAKARGYSLEELERVRVAKVKKRGGFEKKIYLKEVRE